MNLLLLFTSHTKFSLIGFKKKKNDFHFKICHIIQTGYLDRLP